MHAHTSWAEVAPLAPFAVLLGEWCALIFILGCVFVIDAFVTALLSALAGFSIRIPFIGDPIAHAIHKAESGVSHALGIAEGWLDARIGGAWHEMARLVDWTYREIRSHANLIYTLAAVMVGANTVAALRGLIHSVHSRVAVNDQRITSVVRRLETAEHRLAHQVTAGVLPRIGRLEREYDRVIDKDIARLRDRTKAVEGEFTKVWDYVRSHPWTIVTDTFVGAVAVALAKLGYGWLRCPTLKSVVGKHGCNLWSKLDGLLGLLAEAALVTNMCTVIPWLERGFSVVAAPLISTLTTVGAGLCNPADKPPELLPTVDLHLPAAPGFTLHLP